MNVVILMNDQHAHSFLGCADYPGLQTPTYDRLAQEGIRFTQATCAVSPCLPSRHSMLHGRYAFQSGIYSNRHLLNPAQIPEWTMGKAFGQAGFVTGAFGKMHTIPYQAAIERDNYYGFDHRAGPFHETGERMDSHFVAEHRDWVETGTDEREARGIGRGGDNCAAAFKGFTTSLRLEQTRDWWVGGQAAAFVEENKDNPFFMICSLSGPHAPHVTPANLADLYDPADVALPPEPPDNLPDRDAYPNFVGLEREELRDAIANYMAFVTACDQSHQQVINALDRNGLYDDTLIIFLSDHGELLGSRGVTAFSKYNLYEQAIRIPFIVKPPKGFQTGLVNDSLVNLLDVLPTAFDFAGMDIPVHLPGMSLKSLVDGREREREVAITELQYPRDLNLSIRTQEWKYIHGPYGPELYHIAEDPYEFVNLANDPAHSPRISELQAGAIAEYRRAFERGSKQWVDYPTQPWNAMTL
ncbi:MAG: sulfatase-like hydrolase/transferase [Gemmatimonadetes bacterium]|nr:sulfatase-like hydrolase/transferase [Gemmatimonadota bacterium]MYK54496.1 sulfatase-like hydrolase/transferase [Gemmatimonadota bacterium]